ncbi:MAG TPA: hypothetical protein GXZ82_04850 [Firmicutes bacterium]|nr:hypothetical protein [Bacillota bacterium]
MQNERSKSKQTGLPKKAVNVFRNDFQHQLDAAIARRTLRHKQHDHLDTGGSGRSRLAEDREAHAEHHLGANARGRRFAVASGMVAVTAVAFIIAFWILRWFPQSQTVALAQSESLILWHDGNNWEHRQLVELSQVFGSIKEISVIIEVKTDLWGELIRAVVLQKPPDLAIVSEESARRLLASQALTPFNKAHMTTEGTSPSHAYFGFLAPPTPWARSQVLVMPRTTQPSEPALQFAEFLLQSL